MPLRHEYDEDEHAPAAPVISVTFSVPSDPPDTRPIRANALIDSGADCTCVPSFLVDQLRLKPARQEDFMGYDGTPSRRLVYEIRVIVDGMGEYIVPAAAIPVDEPLLGRDLINRWRLLLDGPGRVCEINSDGLSRSADNRGGGA